MKIKEILNHFFQVLTDSIINKKKSVVVLLSIISWFIY